MKTLPNNNTTKKLVWLALVCVLLVNAAILAKVFFNRSEVMAKLQLSERELQLPYNYGFDKEDSSKRVSLLWATPNLDPTYPELGSLQWQYDRNLRLSAAHFASFQFPSCAKRDRLRLKREAWVLIEFNGKSYADHLAQVEQYYSSVRELVAGEGSEITDEKLKEKYKHATEMLEDAKSTDSRLFIIDAAAERDLLESALRSRPTTDNSQLFIVPAELHPSYHRCENSTDVRVNNLAVESLYIPKDFAQGFHEATMKAHFTAEIFYGRLYEPWINSLNHL